MEIPVIYLFRKTWHYAGNNRRNLVLYSGMFVVANLLNALEPLVIGLFLNAIQVGGVDSSNVLKIIGFICLLPILEVFFWSLHGPARVMEGRNAFIVRSNYKNFLLHGTMSLPIDWHTDHHSGDTIDKIEKGSNALYSFSERTFEFIETIIRLITSFAVLFYYDLISGTVALVITLSTLFIISLFDKKLVPGYKKVNKMDNATSAKVFDSLSNVTTVIVLRVEALVLKTINLFIHKPYQQYDLNNRRNEWKWFSAAFLGQLAVVFVLCSYVYRASLTGTILVGTVYILYGYAYRIRDIFFRFAYLYNDVIRYRASVSNAEELSKEFKALPEATSRLPKAWQTLAIKNLSFSYSSNEAETHLNNLSLSLRKGERVALIGDSGGGKSTLLKLIRDLYHPRSLEMSIDGQINSGGFSAISNSISLIPQDPEIFATTIRENITLGVEYDDMHIQVFTDMACFTEVVKRLPKHLDSSIVEKGVNLSGGEKQRLALARGLLASVDKDIILLDEPTSSVDFQNELKVFENIFNAFSEKTIIASVHRLHLLSLFESIYFIRDGSIIAAGSFEDLKKSSPEFQALWDKYIKSRDAGSQALS